MATKLPIGPVLLAAVVSQLMIDSLTALAEEGAAFEEALKGLGVAEFTRVTNCAPWTLSELVVHVAGSIRIGEFRPAEKSATLHEPADYYRRPERSDESYRHDNVKNAQRLAAALAQRNCSASEFMSSQLQRTLTYLGRLDLDQPVQISRVGAMRLRDWLVSRVISVAAHGLDVAITLRRDPWTTRAAHEVMRPALVSLLGSRTPELLACDDQRFLALATGRCTLTAAERALLGPEATRFPLLS